MPTSQRTTTLNDAWSMTARVVQATWMHGRDAPDACDFVTGNPQEGAIPGHIEILQKYLVPQTRGWHGYHVDDPAAQAAAALALGAWCGTPFEADDILLTNGGFGALSASMKAVADPGDEVIIVLPPWMGYEPLAVEAGLTPVKVWVDLTTFDLDLDAIQAAISPRTRAIIVNTPHNPTGKVYPAATLERLAALLEAASRRNGRTIYLISDEAYQRVVFGGGRAPSPASFYPNTLLCYTYGKKLLAPGLRLGYVALAPEMPDREQMRWAISLARWSGGYLFPDAFLQYALPELESLNVDVPRVGRRRDRLVRALQGAGYRAIEPEGTFFMLVTSPWDDDLAFAELLSTYGVYVVAGSSQDMPGYIRLSLTANDDMVERSISKFRAALEHARLQRPVSKAVAAADGQG